MKRRWFFGGLFVFILTAGLCAPAPGSEPEPVELDYEQCSVLVNEWVRAEPDGSREFFLGIAQEFYLLRDLYVDTLLKPGGNVSPDEHEVMLGDLRIGMLDFIRNKGGRLAQAADAPGECAEIFAAWFDERYFSEPDQAEEVEISGFDIEGCNDHINDWADANPEQSAALLDQFGVEFQQAIEALWAEFKAMLDDEELTLADFEAAFRDLTVPFKEVLAVSIQTVVSESSAPVWCEPLLLDEYVREMDEALQAMMGKELF